MTTSVALITGVLTGIGRATAFAFAREGYRVVATGRHDEAGLRLADELRSPGDRARRDEPEEDHRETPKHSRRLQRNCLHERAKLRT